MRQPSPMSQLYAWHRAALAGQAPLIHDGLPEAGWYRTRFVKGGPWVAVEIRVEREIDPETFELTEPERLVAIADGERRDPSSLWTFLEPISRAEHDAIIARAASWPAMQATKIAMDLSQEPVRP
jgi:hypothetical protein